MAIFFCFEHTMGITVRLWKSFSDLSNIYICSMKIYTLLILSVFLSCKSTSYFSSPNDILEKDCTMALVSGATEQGKLSVQFETGHTANNFVMLRNAGGVAEKIPLDSVNYYQLGNEYFFPKEINLDAYDIPGRYNVGLPNVRNILFVKRLTKEGAAIGLFELFISGRKTNDGFDHYDYFVSFANHDRLEAISTRGNLFFPKFNEKMSDIVKDCPALAGKVKQKENGYSLGQISIDAKKNEVIKKIIFEYNDCTLKAQETLKIK